MMLFAAITAVTRSQTPARKRIGFGFLEPHFGLTPTFVRVKKVSERLSEMACSAFIRVDIASYSILSIYS